MTTDDVQFTIVRAGGSADGRNEGVIDDSEKSPYVNLADPLPDVECMVDSKEIVITKPNLKVEIDYPLNGEFVFELHADDPARGFERGELALKIAGLYEGIYAAEAETAPDPGRAAPNLYNRGRSSGTYGIWGHDLGDLVLHTVAFDAERNLYTLGIDS